MKVLVVEDDALTALVVYDALYQAGHLVVGPASRPSEAIALCALGPPDLAVIDVGLPDGGDGTALARTLFARWGVRTVFATGLCEDARRAKDVALGCIEKPYEPALLVQSVDIARTILDGQAPDAAPSGLELYGDDASG